MTRRLKAIEPYIRAMKRRLKVVEPYIWLLPSSALMLVFVFVPIGQTIWLSLCDISKAAVVKSFSGLDNYIDVVKSKAFWKVMENTLIWTVLTVGISTLLGFIMAMVLNKQFRGRKVARTILIFPWATALAITAAMWDYMFDYEYGALNALFNAMGVASINWLVTPGSAFMCMIVVAIVVTVPFITFCLLSGLQTISPDLYESASIDGASAWQRMTHITIPCLRPAFDTSTVLNVIYVFNSFPIIWTITQGAPAHQTDTITTYLYYLAFKDLKYGRASALSVIGFVILLGFALYYMKYSMKGDSDL